MGKKTSMTLDPKLLLYVGGLVFLWVVDEREGSLPCPHSARLMAPSEACSSCSQLSSSQGKAVEK